MGREEPIMEVAYGGIRSCCLVFVAWAFYWEGNCGRKGSGSYWMLFFCFKF
ncbi:hypothetical protein GQ55_4G198800 [Panicum hallii var. hallii]|uniref:Transmembrane protein n=1 Tax=Panicum hallii var. hallii TaxID=1504633 RepID=A0A2T7DZ32_9POAL|nr:hypothetical protein GQ55_4G198800 [Panicum hallii var. hallii]